MKRLPLSLPMLASGCMSNAANQQAAINATESRATFELNCESVSSSVLAKVSGVAAPSSALASAAVTRKRYCLNPTTCNAIAETARMGAPSAQLG
ncbi:hypothetical protein AADS62_004772 [Escherichia coli]